MKAMTLTWMGLVLAASATAGAAPPQASSKQAALAEARAATRDLGRTLKTELLHALAERGTAGAVSYCHRNAQRLTADVGARHGVHMGRIGTRVRNPINAPQGWRLRAIEKFAAAAARGEDPAKLEWVSENTDHTVLRYARGIKVQGVCLTCHGSHVAPDVRAAIKASYPNDRATGYDDGELRGAFWVEVPIKSASSK